MPRTFRFGKQFWVLFGLMAISCRILTGAPEAQVNFTSLFIDQRIEVTHSHAGSERIHESSLLNNADANSIPERHHTYAIYKKYISPDNHFANLAIKVQYSLTVDPKFDFSPRVAKENQKIKPNSHSPPAVVSALTPTHTTTTDSSVVLEKKFGALKVNNSYWKFRGFNI